MPKTHQPRHSSLASKPRTQRLLARLLPELQPVKAAIYGADRAVSASGKAVRVAFLAAAEAVGLRAAMSAVLRA